LQHTSYPHRVDITSRKCSSEYAFHNYKITNFYEVVRSVHLHYFCTWLKGSLIDSLACVYKNCVDKQDKVSCLFHLEILHLKNYYHIEGWDVVPKNTTDIWCCMASQVTRRNSEWLIFGGVYNVIFVPPLPALVHDWKTQQLKQWHQLTVTYCERSGKDRSIEMTISWIDICHVTDIRHIETGHVQRLSVSV
jgi:hypothetical protein